MKRNRMAAVAVWTVLMAGGVGRAAVDPATLAQTALGDTALTSRIFAVRAIGALGAPAAPVVEGLGVLLTHESLSLRAETLESFGKLGPHAAVQATAVEARLQDAAEDPYLRRLAAEALGRMGPAGADALVRAFTLADDDLAVRAALSLGAAADTEAVARLITALADPDARMRRLAALALAKRGAPALPAYDALTVAAGDRDPLVRRNAVEALGRLGDARAVALCETALKDRDAGVAYAAAGAIETLATNAADADRLLADYRAAVAWKPSPGKEKEYRLTEKERQQYEIGGPLAGLRLPLFKGQHGEEPGYPGCLPELIASSEKKEDMGNTYEDWGPQGMAPEVELYPGAVEHYRNYMFKYYSARSFYDRQSQLKNWIAADLAGVDKARILVFAEPVYHVPRHSPPRPTGRFRSPVSVVRCAVGDPAFTLDLGVLEPGLYTVRVIGAVENKNPRRFIEPLFLRFRVNAGIGGALETSRIRCGYVDQFYSMAELYFYAFEKRAYQAEVAVDAGSKVELLVHNLTLDDVLTGTVREPIKRKPILAHAPEKVRFAGKWLAEERRLQDAEIWNAQPPLNAQGVGSYWPARGGRAGGDAQADVARFGQDGLTEKEIADQYGVWKGAGRGDVYLVNEKLGLRYTRAEYLAGKALPDPYPYKDTGAGLYQPNPTNTQRGEVLAPIADWVFAQRRFYGSPDTRKLADAWMKTGDADAAREEAVRLIRIALHAPAVDIANDLASVTCIPAAYGRDLRCRRRESYAAWLSHYPNYIRPIEAYDKLFTYIDGNEELAASIGRFVPWVKTSKDLVQLLDTYLVQTIAKRIMRYHYATGPTEAGDAALMQGNQTLTEPWIDWVFSRTFVYPLKPSGLQNLMISGCDRSGPEYIGSTFYAQGEGAARVVRSIEKLLKNGILPERYDLTRTDLYPKPLAQSYWHLAVNVAGQEFLRIGDVTGADKPPAHILLNVPNSAVDGWNWSRDPRFAWMLKHVTGRKDQSDAEWTAIEAAAATVKRAPWLDLRSRQVYNWAGILETGLAHDDWRFRRAVYVRTGLGIGHEHGDSLDLQVVAHGLPMTMDGGQRGGYSTPGSGTTRVHNLVEVNGRGHAVQAWTRTLSDATGARFMDLAGLPPNGARLYRRQVSLIDVDEGSGSRPLAIAEQQARTKLPVGVTTPNSYVFDVFRVSGGQTHTYCFHGPVCDELTVNGTGRRPVVRPVEGQTPDADQEYLRPFHAATDTWFAADAPATLEATWRYTRTGGGSEGTMAGRNYDTNSPRKFTRLHLLDAAGLRVLEGAYNCHNNGYRLHNVFAQKRGAEGADLESAFTALIEPYVGEPFIEAARMLEIAENEADAQRAVAVEVKTRNGHTDLLMADGRPEMRRTVRHAAGDIVFSGESGFYSTDAQGLRLVALTGGTTIEGPELKLKAAAAEFRGLVRKADYLTKTVELDGNWPTALSGRILEIGTSNRTTSYTLTGVRASRGQTTLTLDGGADFLQALVEEVDPTNGVVLCAIKPALGKRAGLDRDFTASNDQRTQWWRADYLDNGRWQLTGAPVKEADFEPSRFLRLWEYGVGDTVRCSTDAALERVEPGVYALSGSVDVTVGLKAKGLEISTNRAQWEQVKGRTDGVWFEGAIALGSRSGDRVYLRLVQ